MCEDDPCAGVECGQHGACADGACVCDAGWSGDYCDATPFPGSQLITPEDGATINSWIAGGAPCGGTHPFAEQYQQHEGDVPGDWFCYTQQGAGIGGHGVCSYTGSAPTPTPGGSWGGDQPACLYGQQFGPNVVWERCFSSAEDDSSTPATFHRLCDPYDVTVSVAHNSLGYTFGGFAEHSWGRAACCADHPDTCLSNGCIDTTAVNNFIFSLDGPAGTGPERFAPTGRSNNYQLAAPTTFPQWGDGGQHDACDGAVAHNGCGNTDLCMGWNGPPAGDFGRPLSDGTGHCRQGSTYEGTHNQVCGGDANWNERGETVLEVWRLVDALARSQPFCVMSIGASGDPTWYMRTGGDPAVRTGWDSDAGDRCCRVQDNTGRPIDNGNAPGEDCLWWGSQGECEAALPGWRDTCLSCDTLDTAQGCPTFLAADP
jgi:hypothetical protein